MVTRPSPRAGTSPRLSYKFQRLREQIRAAIVRGELTGRLPGERELARRFAANAKTINKALCDLTSEGLVIRRIGRGTFVSAGGGESAKTGPTLLYILLLSIDTAAASYRQNMVSELQRALKEKGGSLNVLSCDRLVDEQIPLVGWPADRRRRSAAIACYPVAPLSGGVGHLSDECILESYRRQVPAVVIGALSRSARLSAAAPDCGDAGFRLAEHLFRAGCGSVVVALSTEGREAGMVAAGAQAGGIRLGRVVTPLVARKGAAPWDHLPIPRSSPAKDKHVAPTGVLCVGSTLLDAAAADQALQARVADGSVLLACVTEPGDGAGERYGVTSYEVDPQRIAEWAARLLDESRAGDRPREILVVGDVRVRGDQPSPRQADGARRRQDHGPRRAEQCESGAA
jgi:DNA-binding transcriptional regulator YhcF (GntR family)